MKLGEVLREASNADRKQRETEYARLISEGIDFRAANHAVYWAGMPFDEYNAMMDRRERDYDSAFGKLSRSPAP